MSSFEYCVLAGIFLHLVVLVWVLLWIKAQLDLIGGILNDMRQGLRNINQDTFSMKKNVKEARQNLNK